MSFKKAAIESIEKIANNENHCQISCRQDDSENCRGRGTS